MPEFPKAPSGSKFANLFAGLERAGSLYAGATSKGGLFTCPVHDDANASLEVDLGSKGVPLVSCPPCEAMGGHAELVSALRDRGVFVASGRALKPEELGKLDWGDELAPGRSGRVNGKVRGLRETHERVARYRYLWPDGSENFSISRWEPKPGAEGGRKVFTPRRIEVGTGAVSNLNGVTRTPYGLEKFADWDGSVVYFVEGEKAADALLAAGKHATTFHGGSKQEPEDGWVSRWFSEFKEVRLWPDADEVGVRWMQRRAAELEAAGVKVSWWGRPAGEGASVSDDAYDVLLAGLVPQKLTAEQVEALAGLKPAAAAGGPAEPVERAGKALVPASGGGGLVECSEPYPVAVNVDPYRFGMELVNREFLTDDAVLTLRFRNDDRTFWLWSDRQAHYKHLTDDEVKAIVARHLSLAEETTADGEIRPVKIRARTYGELVEILRVQTLTSEHGAGSLLSGSGGVPFQNGWLDIASGELQPIGPERDIRWNVPAEYDPDAVCPEWFKFLDSIGWVKGSEERRLFRQWLGYLIAGSVDQQKAMLLLGPKRAGKGTLLAVCEGLLGDGAVGTQLDAFANNFGMQNLIGKGLATIGDARFGFRTDKKVVERILSLTSGDTMTIDVKHKEPLSVRLAARLMVATNESPKFIEASDALATRFVVLELTKSFYGHEDKNLRSKILAELPGIARWALGGYKDLIGLGSFIETSAGLRLQDQMIRDAAPVRVFVEEECELGSQFSVSSQDLFGEYALWCEQNRMFLLDRQSFFRDLNTAFPGQISDFYPRVGGKQVRSKRGIRMRAK